jgi:hypothetical protein
MSAMTIPFGAPWTAHRMIVEIIRKKSAAADGGKTLTWPQRRRRVTGVLVNQGGLPTQVSTRGLGGLLFYPGGLTTDLCPRSRDWRTETGDWGGGHELHKLTAHVRKIPNPKSQIDQGNLSHG